LRLEVDISGNVNLVPADGSGRIFASVAVESSSGGDGFLNELNLGVKTPDEAYKVKVKFPWIRDTEGDDVRVVLTFGIKDRGTFILPEVDDEVLILFEHGDIRFPYILGVLYNGEDKPAEFLDGLEIESEYSIEDRTILKTYFAMDDGDITLNETYVPLDIPRLDEYSLSLNVYDFEPGEAPLYDLDLEFDSAEGSEFISDLVVDFKFEDDGVRSQTTQTFEITIYETIKDPATGRELKVAVAMHEIIFDLIVEYEDSNDPTQEPSVRVWSLEVRVNRIDMA
jgi:hypothetical protein